MVGDLRGVAWFYSSGFEVNSFARALLPCRRCLATLLPALPSPFSGKYVVSIMVPLSFVSVTVPGGCRSQGCHGYPTRSALVLEAPPSFQAPSPSSYIVDEFKLDVNKILRLQVTLNSRYAKNVIRYSFFCIFAEGQESYVSQTNRVFLKRGLQPHRGSCWRDRFEECNSELLENKCGIIQAASIEYTRHIRYISGAGTRIRLRGRGVQQKQDRNQTIEE